MEGRIQHLARILRDAVIVEAGTSDGTVTPGCVVTIRYDGDDDTETYLLGSIEERREGVEIMSPGSVLGEALIGKRAGESVEYDTPTGARLKVEVVSVGQ